MGKNRLEVRVSPEDHWKEIPPTDYHQLFLVPGSGDPVIYAFLEKLVNDHGRAPLDKIAERKVTPEVLKAFVEWCGGNSLTGYNFLRYDHWWSDFMAKYEYEQRLRQR